MEIFGSTFDDSVFLEARDRVCVSLSSYNAKLCEPEWFCDNAALDTEDSLEKQKVYKFRGDLAMKQGNYQWFCDNAALDTEDSLEKQKVYKFRGDLAMKQGNYQEALEAYSSCLEWIADNNLTIRRDVLEGMARSCTKLGQRDKALELANVLSKEASNTCHLTSLLLLKVSIYQHFGAIRSKMMSLQQLCSLLPFNPWHWFNLGQMCLHLLESKTTTVLCESARELNVGEAEEQQEEAADLDEDTIWLKACTCFVRTRILRQQQCSFVLQRSESTLQTTDEAIQRLSPKEKTLQALTEVMSEDLIPEKMREDYQDGESLASVCVQSFRDRWWNKILLNGVLETDAEGSWKTGWK
ncbi:putative protein C8orf76 [Channa argus]|uniref:Uncharacterized protein n=1 Tax=Channa argus TaxID=215402 RepID=A0A6G1PMY0_CHAAH|nr:putative protein C8orf76 [Channa argus]